MNDTLRQRKAAGVTAVVNAILAVIVLVLGRNIFAIILAIFLLGWVIAAVRKWVELGRS